MFTTEEPASVNGETNTSTGLTLEGPGLAVHGYDVVSYFSDGEPAVGSAKFAAVHNGATYRFATEDHLAAFTEAPTKFVPAYGGYCAYGVSVGAKFDGDPRLWRIVNNKLYLNLSEDIQATWAQDIPDNIEKADQSWPEIAAKSS